MGKGLNYVQRRQLSDQTLELLARQIERQFTGDMYAIALHRLYGFGRDRLVKLHGEVGRLMDQFEGAFYTKNTEADKLRHDMDVLLYECYRDCAVSFDARYPAAKKIRYGDKTNG